MGIAAVAQYKLLGDITANSVVVTKILQGGTKKEEKRREEKRREEKRRKESTNVYLYKAQG
jgi:hypothetical protein